MAGTLITARQYERGLDSVNELRPLRVSDNISNVLSLPVAERNPPNSFPPSRGKLLGSDNEGGIIQHGDFLGFEYDGLQEFYHEYYRKNRFWDLGQYYDFITITWETVYGLLEISLITPSEISYQPLIEGEYFPFYNPPQLLGIGMNAGSPNTCWIRVYCFNKR